jgi:hypothetical protein
MSTVCKVSIFCFFFGHNAIIFLRSNHILCKGLFIICVPMVLYIKKFTQIILYPDVWFTVSVGHGGTA